MLGSQSTATSCEEVVGLDRNEENGYHFRLWHFCLGHRLRSWGTMNKVSIRAEMLVVGGLAILAAVLCIFAHWEPRFPGDLRLTRLLQSIDSRALDSIMEWVSFLSGTGEPLCWPLPVAF